MKNCRILVAVVSAVAFLSFAGAASAEFSPPAAPGDITIILPEGDTGQIELRAKLGGSGTESACQSRLEGVAISWSCVGDLFSNMEYQPEYQYGMGLCNSMEKLSNCEGRCLIDISKKGYLSSASPSWGDTNNGGNCNVQAPVITLITGSASRDYPQGEVNITTAAAQQAADADGDGVADASDNCPNAANADQHDMDNDGKGNVCDEDRDGDGVLNNVDNCPDVKNADQIDYDGDGKGHACDSVDSPSVKQGPYQPKMNDAPLQQAPQGIEKKKVILKKRAN